ncbi:MAG: Mov34/MPN/PAD-1 family protein [Acidimicrobiales bacterium]
MTAELLVEPAAWQTILDAAGEDAMRETGGVLLGWRHEKGIYVHDALVVSDSHAKHTFYRRRHKPATDVLDAALAVLPGASPIGYVGEWHSHPAPTGPSWVDRFEMRRISRQTKAAVGLLVCAYDAKTGVFTPVGVVAERGRTSRAKAVFRDGDEY